MPDDSIKSLVSVIIVNFNGRKFLPDCLSSLFKQTYSPFEVLFVDNASQDGSVDFIKADYPSVRFFIQKENLGFAGGSNAGIREARGEYILTLNNDTVVCPEFIQELVQPMIQDPSVGMCASKMVFPDGRINSTAICISRSGAAWDRGGGKQDQGQYDAAEEVFGPCAGAALYRRTMLDEIGLFDEDFFLFMEDVDLAFRARLAGWRCMYVPTARVVHIHGGTAPVGSDDAIYYGNRNILWYVVKNFPLRIFLRSFPWILGRNCGVIPYYIISGHSLAILKAKTDSVKGLPIMIEKRKRRNPKIQGDNVERWLHVWMK